MTFLLQHLVTEAAGRAPDAVAVRCGEELVTYGELELRSNRLAHGLRNLGVQPGDRVALHLRKSIDGIVALYAILKAGACYVPVEATNPASRLADIVDRCAIRCIVTSASATEKLSAPELQATALEVAVLIDADDESVIGELRVVGLAQAAADTLPDDPPAVGGTDQDLAYVLFTSGSTGRPKGVMLSHLNALTFVNWGHDTFAVRSADRLANNAPWNFDLSVFYLFVAARAGAAVTLVQEGHGAFPVRLVELLRRDEITISYSVPSVLTLIVTHGGLRSGDLEALRLVLFAGEVFPVKHLRALMQALPDAAYFNLYGPTETNVCTFYEVQELPDPASPGVAIGQACANTEIVILDEQGHRVDNPGTEGLLHVRGSTVMQGYYGDPEATARSLRRNPAAHGREEDLYCTGDWVTRDEHGDLIFHGRRDHMVKIRGYRVELGEIEAALHAHPRVREAVAIPIPDEVLGNKIRAVVVAANEAMDANEIKRHCATRLPRYMVPEDVEFRTALPRTVNDKVDRPRLLAETVDATTAAR
jgi:amino acid adenylation domain-containing protein